MIWIPFADTQMPRTREHHTTDDTLPLDIRVLQRSAQLRGNWSRSVHWTNGYSKSSVGLTIHDGDFVTISYADGNGGSHFETLDITWTRPNFGGERPWWTCPRCSRRCAIVYALGSNPFVCRFCASLTYVTAQSDRFTRAMRKRLERERRLGWQLGSPFPSKPKGMHWQSWERLVTEFSAVSSAAHIAFEKWADQMDRICDRPVGGLPSEDPPQ